MITLKVTKKQGFTLSRKNSFLEKPKRGSTCDSNPPPPPQSRPFLGSKVTLGTFVDFDYFTSYLLTKETVNKRNCMKTRWRNFLCKRNAVKFVRSILESPH